MVREISEKLAARLGGNVVVAAGVHWEDINSREIRSIESLLRKMSAQILERFEGNIRTIPKKSGLRESD